VRLYVQWTTSSANDWQRVNVTSNGKWAGLPAKPEPRGGEVIDDQPGYVHALNCQGVEFTGKDHYHVRRDGSALVVTVWNDDPQDWPPGTRWAEVWTFDRPRPDPKVGGRTNTVQYLTVYREPGAIDLGTSTTGGPIEYRDWSEFVPPTVGVKHGIWTTDDHNERHSRARSTHGWREWTS